jgi:hypothetical protein
VALLLLLPVPAAATLVLSVVSDHAASPALHAHLDDPPPGVDIHRTVDIAELRAQVRLDRYPGRPEVGLADQLAGFRAAAGAWFVLCGLCD